MKIGEQVKQLEVVGDQETKRATISADKMAKLQYLLTKGLYRDPTTAVIAEWTNNGIDSVVQSGKDPIETPVIVTIGTNMRGQYTFSVEDKGTGLNDQEFENICMNYLESTKENDNNAIGHFGIGMKSFLSLERSATFTCRKDGVERVYLVYEGEEFVNYDLLKELPTSEEDGVKAELIISNIHEKSQFIKKTQQKLAYYDTVMVIIDGKPVDWEIKRNELFQMSSANGNSQMHLCLKDVYYAIDWESLGISPLHYPIALRFGLDSGIIPTPSRESYITNEKTKKLIMGRIAEVAEWIVTKYNNTVKEFGTFREAYPYLGTAHPELFLDPKDVHKGFRSFPIYPIADYSKTKVSSPRVKGVELIDATFYKNRAEDLFYEFIVVGYVNSSGVFRTPKGFSGMSPRNQLLHYNKNPVLVNEGLKGNMREYLKEKHGRDSLFVRLNPVERKLGSTKANHDFTSYTSILDLHLKKKTEWRKYIDEWKFVRDQLHTEFVDERKADLTKEYQDWLEKRKFALSSKRKTHVYKGLGKQEGDVTIAYINSHKRGIGWAKSAYPIANLTKNRYLTVLIEDDDDESKEKAKRLYKMLKCTDTVRFAIVGKKERKKIPDHFQFINFQQFMTRDCKPFMRLASALAFERALEEFYKVSRYKNGIFQHCLAGLLKDSKILEDYVTKNMNNGVSDEVTELILTVADEHKLYDYELWDLYLRMKEGTKKYDFITCLVEPRIWDNEEQKRYTKTINQLLLFRKLYYDDLPEGAEITFKEKEVTV